MSDVTRILSAIESGDPSAAVELLPLVYRELQSLATQKLANEKPGQTLQATALVHEAYLRLIGSGSEPDWNSRGHFFGAAAEAMRRILVENARRKGRMRHGGDRGRIDLNELDPADDQASENLLALDEALAKLAAEKETVAQVVKLRYFAGLTIEQAALSLDISVRTANRRVPLLARPAVFLPRPCINSALLGKQAVAPGVILSNGATAP